MKKIMRKKPLVVLIFTLQFYLGLIAQNVSSALEIGNLISFENNKREVFQKVLTKDETGYYFLFADGKFGKGDKSIRKFDSKLQPTDYRINLDIRKKGQVPETLGVIDVDDAVFHIWSVLTRKGKDYYGQHIDLPSGIVGEEKLIAHVERKEAVFEYSTTKLYVDQQTKRVYLYYNLPKNFKSEEAIRIHLLDKNLNQIRTENYSFPFVDWNFDILELRSYQENKTLLIAKNYQLNNHGKSIKQKKYSYLIYMIENNQARLIKEIMPKGEYINGLRTTISSEGKLLVSGLLGNQNILTPSGVYFLNLDLKSFSVLAEKRTPLSVSFYENPESKDKKRSSVQLRVGYSNRNKDGNYFPIKLIECENGETILLAEQAYSMEGDMGKIVYYNNAISLFKISSEGDLLWSTKVKKQQTRANTNIYSSFYPKYHQGILYLLYNGNIKNVKRSDGKLADAFSDPKDRALICTKVDEKGSHEQQVISYYSSTDAVMARPGLTANISDAELLFFGQFPGNLKKQGFIKIKYSD